MPPFLRWLPVLIALALPGAGSARAADSLEYQVKAAMLYNFTRFVTWPQAGDVRLCLVGNHAFDDVLAGLAGKPAGAGTFVIQPDADTDTLARCEMVFIGAQSRDRLVPLLQSLAGQPVLTVSDDAEFIQKGGIVQFLVVDGKVRFAINPDAAQRAGLQISAKLLSLATIQRKE